MGIALRVVVVAVLSFLMFGLSGCGGDAKKNDFVTGFGWVYDNVPPDYYNDGTTCLLRVMVYFNDTIAPSDIESCTIESPNGWEWPLSSSQIQIGGSSHRYVAASLVYGENSKILPLAGKWTATIKLKGGAGESSVQQTFHDPGSSSTASHRFLYTPEDFTPYDTNYVATLRRFPNQGFAVHYSMTTGIINTTGFATVSSSYHNGEPKAYNMYCILYDANHNLLGGTITEYSRTDHATTPLKTPGGELQITPSTTSPSGSVDLSQVKYIRIVTEDGDQFAPSSYSSYDCRALSGEIPVN